MMPLENQLCTLEHAKKFDELGVKAESYFVWITGVDGQLKPFISVKDHARWKPETLKHSYPAYSSAELGVLLPTWTGEKQLLIYKDDEEFIMGYKALSKRYTARIPFSPYSCKEHEAHAKAEILIELLEKGIVKPQDLKL